MSLKFIMNDFFLQSCSSFRENAPETEATVNVGTLTGQDGHNANSPVIPPQMAANVHLKSFFEDFF